MVGVISHLWCAAHLVGIASPQFLQCGVLHIPLVNNILATRYPGSAAGSSIAKTFHLLTFVIKNTT